MEKAYLTGDRSLSGVLLALLVPVYLAALALAFWRRSVLYGLVVIDAMMLSKVA